MKLLPTVKTYVDKVLKGGETRTNLYKTFFIYGFIGLTLLLMRVLIARFYGAQELGIFTYFFSITNLAFLFTSFGLCEALTQTIVKDQTKLKSALKLITLLLLPFSLVFTIIFLFILKIEGFHPQFSGFTIAFVLFIIAYTIHYLTYSLLRGFKRFTSSSMYSLLNRIFFIALLILFFALSLEFIYVLYALSLAAILATIIAIPEIKKLWPTNETKENLKPLLHLALGLFLMQISFYSLRYIDVIVIKYLVDYNSVGIYSAYSSISNVIRMIAYVFPVVVLPMAAVSSYKLTESFKKMLILLLPFTILTLIATIILMPILYGPEYSQILLPSLLILSSSFILVYSFFNAIFVGENEYSSFYIKILLIDVVLSIIVSTILTIFFVKLFGLSGAPLATALAVLLKILLNIYAIKKLRKNKKAATPSKLQPIQSAG